jgi:hypothetical protein
MKAGIALLAGVRGSSENEDALVTRVAAHCPSDTALVVMSG